MADFRSARKCPLLSRYGRLNRNSASLAGVIVMAAMARSIFLSWMLENKLSKGMGMKSH
nr:hypothetical protein [Legionella oakridgensis]